MKEFFHDYLCRQLKGSGMEIKMDKKIDELVDCTRKKLIELGVECPTLEELQKVFGDFPEEVLENMEELDVEAMLVDFIASRRYNTTLEKWEEGNPKLCSFDVERFWGAMYGDPLYFLNDLFEGEFVISDVVESDWAEAEEAGVMSVDFKINGMEYHYDAKYEGDWFDTDIFERIAEATESKVTGKQLYMTVAGPQSVMLVYETDEWAAEFEKRFWKLERL